ncbi:MAG: hypothetical protein L6R41_005651 [Letrouitia leprolyta]|nr:MAG: hypothetical protein L6R41_005651 [Letrouitia leprolyta]
MTNENYTDNDWIYMVLTGDPKSAGSTSGAHPIHLHGHDFAILQQTENANYDPKNLNLKLDNPPRRDVVLLPQDGFVVIAFKSDNPGAWIMHCHIAFHASFGLALQIMERQTDAINIWPSIANSNALKAARKTCDQWNTWQGDCRNWWAPEGQSSCPEGVNQFSPDSGI